MTETDVFIHSILFGIVMTLITILYTVCKKQEQEKKQDEIELNNKKTNDWLFRVETACNIERFKRNPELWKSVFDAAKNYQEKDYLLNRYTYTHNGKRYWKQYEWKEFKQDD
jgi:hypothetical protein